MMPGLVDFCRQAKGWAARTVLRGVWERRRLAAVARLEKEVRRREEDWIKEKDADRPTVLFFDASSRSDSPSLCAFGQLLVSWGLRLDGARVKWFACCGGLRRCQHGTVRNLDGPPPCAGCRALTKRLISAESLIRYDAAARKISDAVFNELSGRSFSELERYERDGVPFGRLVLPSLRWALRRHNLPDDERTRALYAHYVASAADTAAVFRETLRRERPQAVFMFNGTSFPEAAARLTAAAEGIPVVSFEGGFRRNALFFAHGTATEYPLEIPDGRELTPAEEEECERYLARRFAGDFYIGGKTFWKDMQPLKGELEAAVSAAKQTVTIFTNVVFDTTQATAALAFPDMFAWLKRTGEIAARRPETLFVVRAHPDELWPTRKSAETVEERAREYGLLDLPNLRFIPPTEALNSYDLIRRSKFCVVYNSTIGVEAVILGKPVLSAAKSKYAEAGVVRLARTAGEYERFFEEYLDAERAEVSEAARRRARRYLYFLVFKASLDFSKYLVGPYAELGCRLAELTADDLSPERSAELRIVSDGILGRRKNFQYD